MRPRRHRAGAGACGNRRFARIRTGEEIAFDEAFRRGVDLVALHAWSDVSMSEVPGLDFAAMEVQAQEVLAEWLARWQERYPDVTVRRVVVLRSAGSSTCRALGVRTTRGRRQ